MCACVRVRPSVDVSHNGRFFFDVSVTEGSTRLNGEDGEKKMFADY